MIRSLSMVVAILTTAFCLAWQQPAVPSDTTAPSPTDEAVLSEYKKFVGHWKLVDATRKEVLPQGGETYISEYRIVDGQLIKRYTGKGHLGNLLISLDISDPAESRHKIMMTENNPFRLKQKSRGLYVFEKADPGKGIPERMKIVFNDQGGYPESIDSPNTQVAIHERLPPEEVPDHFKVARADGLVAITLSADNWKVMGYTGNTAEAIPLELDPNVSIQPAVEAYQQYGIVQHGPHQHVFSGRLRQWVTLTLPEPGFPEPMQRDGMIELTSPSKGTFTYDDSVGQWMTTEELKSQALAQLSSVLHPGANTAAGAVRTISSGESAKSYGETQRTDHKPATNAPAAGTIAESQTQMTASQANTAALDRLEPGDVLGVTIEGVLGPPRVADSGKTSLNGFPVTIGEDGEIALPFIPPLKVAGLTLVETREAIRKAYTVDQQILVPGKEWINLTVLRRRADATPNVKVVTLKYAQATEVAEVLKQVYDKGPAKIVPDVRTNSVIVTGPEAQVQEIEALLLKLDESGQANPNARSVPVDPAQSEAAKLVVQLQEELARLQQSVGANHPKVKELQARIAAARQNVQPDAASSSSATPATNVAPLGEIEHLDAEGERLRQRLEADKKNLERSQALMKEGVISAQKAQDAEAPVRLTEALLAAHEAQRSAVLQKFKAQLLKALDDALEYFQSSGQIEKAELQDAEKQIEAIITQVDNSPQQALTAANDLISQLDSELVKQLEKAIEFSPTDPKIGTWQTTLRQAQRRARTRKLLPGSLPATETLFGKYDRAFQAQTEAGSRLPAVSPGNGDGTGSTSGEVQQQIAQLRKEYEAADSEARQLARQLQTTDEAQKNEAQKADLRRAVQRAFTARQSLLRAGLLEMHDKLLKTQRSIDLRERISDQIIQRRVEDLLNPQLKWEGEFPSVSPSPAMGTPQTTSRPLTTELEGKWHGLSMTNLEGIPLSVPLCNVTVQGDRWTNSPSLSPQIVAIDAERKTVRFSNTQPSLYQYELSGDRLTMKSESIIMTLARGHDPALDRIVASRSIPKGLRLFTFSTNDTHTHAGLLRPGDRVDVTVTFVDRKGIMVTKVLLECIEVFATENKTVHSEETQNDQRPRSVSLLVTPEQDGFVKLAQLKGQLGLSLRHPDDEEAKNPNGINAAIMEELQRSIGEDERSLPLITSERETRWRSAVVEILVSGKSDVPDQSPRKVGFGVIVAADGTMLSHMGGGWSSTIKDWPNIDAQFDDGSIVPLQIVDAGGSGFVVLRPKQSVNLNHHFPLSGTTTGIGDQVYVGWMIQTSPDRNYYRLSATIMPLAETDRRVASLGEPVWQLALKQRIPNSLCHPVLSKEGELLAITLTDTGELLLAMPVDKLREILPQSVGKLPVGSTAIRSVPDADGGADLQSALLAQLQGDWSFRGQPIDKDEPQGLRTDVNIKGDLMTFKLTLPDGRQGEASHQIKLGRAGPPQQIDVIFDPNEGTQRMECKGIIEIDAEVVRICLDNSSDSQRPEVFAAGSNAEIWELRRKPSEKPASPAASTPSDPQTAMQAKLQGQWHLTIHPTSALGMGLFLKDSLDAEAVIEGQVMKVFYTKALVPDLLEDSRDPFLAYTVKVTFGDTGSPQPVDLLFGPNEEPVNRRLALGIAEFSDDVIRLCFDRATESESIRPEVFAVGAKGEIWELRREPPTGSRGYVLDRLQGVWQGTWQPDFTLPADVDVPTIDGIVRIQGSRMAVSWQPDEEIEVRLGASGSAQNIDLLFKDRKTKATNELLGVVDVSGEEIILRLGDCNEEDRPKSIVGTKDEATFTLKLSKLPPGAFPDLGAQCELAGPLPQGAGQGKFRGGLRIAKVFAGTPAAQGGFVVGDILVGFHVWEITRLEELQYALAQKLKGEVSFHVIRSGVVRKGYVLLDGSRRPDMDAELSPGQLTSIPVEYDRGIAIPVAQLQKVIPKAQEQQQEKPGDSNPPTVEPDPRDNAGSQDSRLSPLQGRWKVDFFVSPNRAEQWERVEIEGSTLTCFGAIDEKSGFTRVYRLTLGSPDDPLAVDLQETEGNQTFPGLIEKTRDGLALCLGLDGQRPTEFGDGDQRICLRLIPQPAEPEPSPAAADSKASSSDSEKQPSSQQ